MPFDSTTIISSKRRLARLLFLRRKWDLPCLVRTNLPFPPFVRRNRLDVALCVLIFGIFFTLFL